MRNLKINKSLISILLAGTLSLNAIGCVKDIKSRKEKETTSEIASEVINEDIYINKYNISIDLKELNNHAYIELDEETNYTLCSGANMYFKGEWNITGEVIAEEPLLVKVISSNGKYSLIELPTNEKCYVDSGYLVKCVNVHNDDYIKYDTVKDSKLLNDAYLYDDNGMYVGYLHTNEECRIIASNNEYSLISLTGERLGYVLNDSLANSYEKVYGYAFVKAGTPLYLDKKLTNYYRTTDDEILYVEKIMGKYATIAEDGKTIFVNASDLHDDFIDVNLNNQRMDCYIDYMLTNSYPTRTGRDSSPTHTGAFDIDEKITNWEFTTYPGSHAKYWIPISPVTEEGIHDLVGDDEQNYGNEAYHDYGSHGCIRVPVEASEYVYNNYQVGDMVLVRKR